MNLITTEPISANALLNNKNFSHCGAVVTFEGRVRNHHLERRVTGLFYEAYVPMAEAVLRELMTEIRKQWPNCIVSVRHRIGAIPIGSIAVAIAVWAPHRKEAFLACGAMIDRIKQQVPIWKKESYQDGHSDWITCEHHVDL